MKTTLKKAVAKMESFGLKINMLNISYSNTINPAGWLNLSEPNNFINTYWIDIEMFVDDDFEERNVIGSAICHFIDGYYSAYDDLPVDIFDLADAHSAEFLTAVEPVINQEGRLKEEFFGLGVGVLYVDEFYIIPDYRGKGIGTICFAAIKDVIGREAGAITAMPVPREDDGITPIKNTDPRYYDLLNCQHKFLINMGFYIIDRYNDVWANNTALKD